MNLRESRSVPRLMAVEVGTVVDARFYDEMKADRDRHRQAICDFISRYMAGDDLPALVNDLADAAGLKQQEGS